MRCFIAVDLEPGLRKSVEKLQAGLTRFGAKLVEPHNLHFTLKFLGEIDEKTIAKVSAVLAELVKVMKPFDVKLSGVGVFPSENFIRVVWVGAEQLDILQASVNNALSDIFKKEKPATHMTIARVRSQMNKKQLLEFLEKHRNVKVGIMNAGKIKLKKSTVTRRGPVYEDIAVFELMQ